MFRKVSVDFLKIKSITLIYKTMIFELEKAMEEADTVLANVAQLFIGKKLRNETKLVKSINNSKPNLNNQETPLEKQNEKLANNLSFEIDLVSKLNSKICEPGPGHYNPIGNTIIFKPPFCYFQKQEKLNVKMKKQTEATTFINPSFELIHKNIKSAKFAKFSTENTNKKLQKQKIENSVFKIQNIINQTHEFKLHSNLKSPNKKKGFSKSGNEIRKEKEKSDILKTFSFLEKTRIGPGSYELPSTLETKSALIVTPQKILPKMPDFSFMTNDSETKETEIIKKDGRQFSFAKSSKDKKSDVSMFEFETDLNPNPDFLMSKIKSFNFNKQQKSGQNQFENLVE